MLQAVIVEGGHSARPGGQQEEQPRASVGKAAPGRPGDTDPRPGRAGAPTASPPGITKATAPSNQVC